MRLILVAALLFLSSAAYAEDKKPPAGMTPEQYQSMVDDIADAVAKKLAAEPKAKKTDKAEKPEKSAKPAGDKKDSFDAMESVRRLREQTSRFLATIPAYPAALAGVGGKLDVEIHGEKHGLSWMLAWLLCTAVAGVLAEVAVRALFYRFRVRWRSAA